MVIARLIERKRDGGALEPEEWRSLIHAFALGEVPDYQVSALAMAVVFRGLESSELTALTDAMLDSGDRLRWDGFPVPRVDKHSTGGVGDNTSLMLVPLVAAVGAAVPMMSGRALGHTGGTLDKLEAIAGFRTSLSLREAEAQVRRIGCVMLGQTHEIAPADGRLYALRDVTGTVESSPRMTFASESPTRMRSAPPSSDRRANNASYAATITSRSPRCFLARTSRTVTRRPSAPAPLIARRPLA